MTARTAMAEKMIAAGVLTPGEALAAAARKAIDGSPRNFDGALHAFLNLIQNDAALLWALFGDRIDAVAADYLRGIAGERGQAPSAAHDEPTPSPKPQQPRRGLEGIASVAKSVTAAYLSRETELGKPLGHCTKADLQNMAAQNRHRAWFYQAIESQMPPVGDVAAYFDDTALADIDRKWNEAAR